MLSRIQLDNSALSGPANKKNVHPSPSNATRWAAVGDWDLQRKHQQAICNQLMRRMWTQKEVHPIRQQYWTILLDEIKKKRIQTRVAFLHSWYFKSLVDITNETLNIHFKLLCFHEHGPVTTMLVVCGHSVIAITIWNQWTICNIVELSASLDLHTLRCWFHGMKACCTSHHFGERIPLTTGQ